MVLVEPIRSSDGEVGTTEKQVFWKTESPEVVRLAALGSGSERDPPALGVRGRSGCSLCHSLGVDRESRYPIRSEGALAVVRDQHDRALVKVGAAERHNWENNVMPVA